MSSRHFFNFMAVVLTVIALSMPAPQVARAASGWEYVPQTPVTLSAGYQHNLGITAAGTVVAWGANYYGQCDVPSGLSGVVAVAAGISHSLAMRADGTVAAWGYDLYGQTNVPYGLRGVVAVDAGASHSLALKSDGTVIAWGGNYSGQCDVPSGLSGVVAIAAGYSHSIALKSDGTVVAWGANYYGQCNVPPDLSGAVAVSAGAEHSLALKSDGTVVAWGYNGFHQTDVPLGLSRVVALDACYQNLALKTDGTVVAWGDSAWGMTTVPKDLSGVVALAAGYVWSLAMKSDGTVVGWGEAGHLSVPPGVTFQVPPRPPRAQAGQPQAVHPGAVVTLDGSGSISPENLYPLSYAWSIQSAPAGSTATISQDSPASPTASFTPDKWGDYTVKLTVTDSYGLVGRAWVVISATSNAPPVAEAGPDQSVAILGATVQLNGTQSYDPDGDPMMFVWTQLSGPDTPLSGAGSPTPSFVAATYGDYVFQLQVTDAWGGASQDTVTVSFANLAPLADAGGNQAVVQGQTVQLDGSKSSDPNGDPLTYTWSLITRPAGSTASLNAADNMTASFTADLAGEYVVGLVVNDGSKDSPSSNVTIVALTRQDAATETLQTQVDVINSLPVEFLPVVFVNSNMQNALTNKINAALKLIDQGQYAAALDKLETDILPKTDGCALQGSPHKNDWIKDCATQNLVYPEVVKTINMLKGLVP